MIFQHCTVKKHMILGKVSKGAGRLPVGGAIVFFKSVAAVDYVSALFTLSVAARCQHPPKIRLFVRISKCKFFSTSITAD